MFNNTTDFEYICHDVHNIPSYNFDARCEFISEIKDCRAESFIDYAVFIYCGFNDNTAIPIGLCIVWTLILFVALGVAATDFLCPALFVISQSLGLSQNVAGVTLIAFGNGSPDIFAAMAGLRQNRPELVIGGLFGGGAFITMIVIGSIFACRSFRLLPMPFVRDLIFYLIAVSWAFYLFVGPKQLNLYHSIGFLALYAAYVLLVVVSKYWEKGPSGKLVNPHKTTEGDGEHHIEFEGIQPDDDPNAGMVIMKGFFFFGDNETQTVNYDKPPPYQSSMKGSREKNQKKEIEMEELNVKNLPKLIPQISIDLSKDLDEENSEPGTAYGNHLTINGADYNNQFTITSLGKVSILEDTSNFNTVTSMSELGKQMQRRSARRSSVSSRKSRISVFSISKQQMLQVRRQSKEFLEKISPIDFNGWKQQNWGGRGFEVLKAPIRFFLLLTTPMADVEGKASWHKWLSCLHCITGPVFAVYVTGFGGILIKDVVPVGAIVAIAASIISIVMVFTSKYETPPRYYKTYSSCVGFVVAVVWVYFICGEVVSVIRSIGVAFNISEPTIGMTLLAWGTCLLDFVSNLSIARQGFPRMAIAACLGSPLLALLIGVGFQATILNSSSHSPIQLEPDTSIFVVYCALAAGLIMTLLVCSAFKFVVQRAYGGILLGCYLAVMLLVVLVELGHIRMSTDALFH